MLNAKRDTISFIDSKIHDLHTDIAEDISALTDLGQLFTLRERLNKTSAWILNTQLFLKFLLTIFLPILGGAIVQIILERLISFAL